MLTVKDFTDSQKELGITSDELLYVIRTYQFPRGYKAKPEELLPHKDERTAYRVKSSLLNKGLLSIVKEGKKNEASFCNIIKKIYEIKGVNLSETDLENEHNCLFSNLNFNSSSKDVTSEVCNVLNDMFNFLNEFSSKYSNFFNSNGNEGMQWLMELGKKKLLFATPIRLREMIKILNCK